ncbi:MAG: acetylornithine/succinylornithine family transaminase [Clostridia bacterium]|nr:acetylornithine/succinylornithine family transaminase [Clostridia bacterium]
MNTIDTNNEFIANTYARFPINLVSGKGSLVYDENSKEYIDLGTGIGVNAFGFSDDEWKDAVIEQLNKLQHTSNLYYSEPSTRLAELLCKRTGLKKVFFSNSGAEANECAIKVARKYATLKYGDYSHNTIITLRNSFHGRTIATLSATGQDVFHTDFGPFVEKFVYANANDIEDLRKKVSENQCCAIMFEVVQGEGGVCPLTKEFIEEIKNISKENDLLIIIDEVQTGNGRTGELYGYMNFDIQPDIVSTAKGLGGGLPIGATLLGEKVKDVLTPGSHGTTYGANPVCCAGAYNIISRIDDNFLSDIKRKSQYIYDELKDCKHIRSITGLGLMIGIETDKDTKEVINKCIEKGVLVLSAKTKIRLLPPLNIPDDVLKKAINIIKEIIEE